MADFLSFATDLNIVSSSFCFITVLLFRADFWLFFLRICNWFFVNLFYYFLLAIVQLKWMVCILRWQFSSGQRFWLADCSRGFSCISSVKTFLTVKMWCTFVYLSCGKFDWVEVNQLNMHCQFPLWKSHIKCVKTRSTTIVISADQRKKKTHTQSTSLHSLLELS